MAANNYSFQLLVSVVSTLDNRQFSEHGDICDSGASL